MSNIKAIKLDPRSAMLSKVSKAHLVDAARFIVKTNFEPLTGCLLWTGAKKTQSPEYGLFTLANKAILAHRASYRLFCSPVLPEIVVRTCKTSLCVHPGHLAADPRQGPHIDNLFTC